MVSITWAEYHLWCFQIMWRVPARRGNLGYLHDMHTIHKPCDIISMSNSLNHTVAVVDGLTETACTFLPPDMWPGHYCGKTV